MASQTIISLAILKVNWDQQHKGYLDNFVSIVAECIRLSPHDIISIPNLQKELQSRFGLNFPQNALNVILKHVKKYGYVEIENKVYKRKSLELTKLNFHKAQQQVLEKHQSLISGLIEYCKKHFSVELKEQEAEQALQLYLQDNQLIILNATTYGTLIPTPTDTIRNAKYFVGAFVQYLQEARSANFEHFETIVKGNMLANAIFLVDPNQAQRNFRNTAVYFDTRFIIYALGYAGQPRKEPCVELLQLMYETGADLRCFKHTFEETKGIIDGLSRHISKGKPTDEKGASIPSIEYFLSQGYTASDIELLSVQLEKNLTGLRIKVVDKPPYIPEYTIDEKNLDETFKSIPYGGHRELPRQRDVDSISAIMRLRLGQGYTFIEDCKAIFITTNTVLAKICREHFCSSLASAGISPCLTDYTVTNLLWLKKPFSAPDLPRKRIIADCYAATQPDDRLWRHYLAEIEKLQKNGEISTDDYYMLRHSIEAKQAVMELTFGEDYAFTQGTIPEILEFTKEKIRAEILGKMEAERVINEEAAEARTIEAAEKQRQLEGQLETEIKLRKQVEESYKAAQVSETERLSRVSLRANFWALIISEVLKYIILVVLLLGSLYPFLCQLPPFTTSYAIYIIAFFAVVFLLWGVANIVWGRTVHTTLRNFEVWLARILNRIILSLSS
ncbi:hypothetical protein ACFLXL_02315 [Chloroflexota bacterium]